MSDLSAGAEPRPKEKEADTQVLTCMSDMMSVSGQRHDRTALILYGSETGNAQDVADELGRLTERLRFTTQVSPLDEIDPTFLIDKTIVIIAVSTTGQGALPLNARKFWRSLLRKRLPPNFLQHVQFTSFGLGDSSYPKFNWAARKLHKRLIQLGAHESYPRGEADDQHPEGLDATYLPWSTDLRKHLLERFPLQDGIPPIPEDVLLQPKWTLSLLDDACSSSAASTSNGSNPIATANGFHAPRTERGNADGPASQAEATPNNLTVTLEDNSRLTPTTHWQDVRQLSFTTLEQVHYDPGDILTIHPKNASDEVNHFLEVMDWSSMADKPIQLVPTGAVSATHSYPRSPIPALIAQFSTTLRALLMDHLDSNAIPRRSFFSLIAHFTNDPMHKDRLLEFTNPDYVDELYDYTTRPRRSIVEVLQEFESVKIPWQWAATVLPVLRGRQFSIASRGRLRSGPEGGTRFELLVAIVKYRTVIKKIREGVCTKYIAALPVGSQINVTLQKGGLGITKAEARRPVVMIGPGTGVAPIRSLIWERRQWADELKTRSHANGSGVMNGLGSIGESVLFYGCRNREADFFYGSEWQELQEKMPLQVFTAFSRDQRQKIYVQDLIRQQPELLYRLLHTSNGIVYICGSSGKMPQAVREALIEVFQTKLDRSAAEAYLLAMEKEGRYKQETW